MKQYIKTFITIFLLHISCKTIAQSDEFNTQTNIPIKFSVLTEQIGLPTFQSHGSNFGFGCSVGSEFNYRTKTKTALVQTADFYFYSHKLYGNSFVLASLFDFRYKPGKLNIDLNIGPGYMLFFNYTNVYKKVNDTYRKVSNLQNKFCVLGSFTLSYQVQRLRPFVSFSLLVETPFIKSSSPIIPHQILQVGCYYNFKNQKK